MKLRRLLRDIEGVAVRGSKEVEITGLSAHSNLVAPGNLFVAKKGARHDGARFIPEAAKAGAAAVLTDVYDPFVSVTQLIAEDVQAVEALLAAGYYGHPSEALNLVGITGTNGKTTSALLLHHLLEQWSGGQVGLLTTVTCSTGKSRKPASFTTSDLITNQRLLKEMVHADCRLAVMEVSSHGLDQGRVEGLAFDMAIFTNLTREHLDYHETMEQYGQAKAALFRMLPKEGFAIVNRDDPFSEKLLDGCDAHLLTYGFGDADVTAGAVRCGKRGVEFIARYQIQEVSFKVPLIGRFNISNLLAVITAGIAHGMRLEKMAEWLRIPPQIPGRMQLVKNSLGLTIFVDYAHSPDALQKSLESLREICKGSLITLFGCGGERDPGKRSQMGTIAEKYSDLVVVTSDNPRHEDPNSIALEILAGCKKNHRVELDRRKAIEGAIEACRPGDLLLIAGKGHESVQIIGAQVHPFDDAQVARELCQANGRV